MSARRRKCASDVRTVRLGRENAFCARQRARLDVLLLAIDAEKPQPIYPRFLLMRAGLARIQATGDQFGYEHWMRDFHRAIAWSFGGNVPPPMPYPSPRFA